MIFYDILFGIFDSLLTYITVSYLFTAFSDKIKIRSEHILAVLLSFFATVFIENTAIIIIIALVSAIIISLVYKFKWYVAVFLSFVSVAIQLLSELIAGLLMMSVFSMSFGETVSGMAYFVGLIVSRFIGYVIAFVIKTARHRMLFDKFQGRWLLVFTLPLASILISATLISYISGASENNAILAFFGIIFLVISNVLIFFFLDTMYEAIVNKEKIAFFQKIIEEQEERYQELYESTEEIKRIRHDHKNFILGIIAELGKGENEKVKEMLGKELDGQNEKNTVNSGNSVIDVIINSKAKLAKKDDIFFKCSFYRINKMNFSSTDISILIGNALDNAIECAKKVEGKKIIDLSISINDGQMIFTITNPTNKKINVNALETTKEDGINHGYGIFSMKKIAEKYNGDVVFFSTETSFRTIAYLKTAE